MPFVVKSCVFTQEVDKTSICEVDFLVSLAVLSARDGANEVVKGLRANKKRPLLHNLGSMLARPNTSISSSTAIRDASMSFTIGIRS